MHRTFPIWIPQLSIMLSKVSILFRCHHVTFLRNLIKLSLFPFLLAASHWVQIPHKTDRFHHSLPPPNGKNQKSSWAEPTLAEPYMDIDRESRDICYSLWIQIPSHRYCPRPLLSPWKSAFSNVIQMDTPNSQKAFSEPTSQNNTGNCKAATDH